jgi:methylmalonyl-CoA epimerase
VNVDHIGIAVEDLESSIPFFQHVLGLNLERFEESPKHGVRAALFRVEGTMIELLEPLNKESPVSRFLEKRGQGIHHLAFEVSDIEGMLERLKCEGIAMIDDHPREGLEAKKVAFLHPKSSGKVLIELCEH